MRRAMFNVAAAVSLLLCLVAIYSWLRSFVPSPMRMESIDGSLVLLWSEGTIPVDPGSDPFNPANDKFVGIRGITRMLSRGSGGSWLGFRWIGGEGLFPGQTYHIVWIPYWVLILPTAILPLLWLASRRRQRRRLMGGQCLSCGYDLRESKEKCSECGTAIKPAVT